MNKRGPGILLFAGLLFISCKNSSLTQKNSTAPATTQTGSSSTDSGTVYKSDHLIIQRLSAHIYQHISFLTTNDFGKVDCNGMIIVNKKEAIVFDTPTNDESAGELINYLTGELKCKINAIIPTHFHEDCVGGLERFNKSNIPSYASAKTIALLKNKGKEYSRPINAFEDSLVLTVGNKKLYAVYFGEGHTKDNIIGYFPEDKAVFGGCLIKEIGATKGYLEDANLVAWPVTVQRLKKRYPGVKIVIPGHGKSGGAELFDYTIKLFE